MKRFVLSITLLSVGLLILTQVLAADIRDPREADIRGRSARYDRTTRARNAEEESSLVADLDFLADANAVKERLKKHEGLEQELQKVDRASTREMREWGQGLVEERMDLAESVNQQVVDELVLLRQIAVEEGALKTAAAIDGLLLDRQQRFEKISKKIDTAMRRSGRFERGTIRGGRRDPRGTYRGRGQDMHEGRAGRYNPRDRYGDRSRTGDEEDSGRR